MQIDDEELVAGGVYAKKEDPEAKQSLMSTFMRRGPSSMGLLFTDGGRIPVRKHRGGIGDVAHQWDLIARPVPIEMFKTLLKLVSLIDDIIEIVEAHRKKKGK